MLSYSLIWRSTIASDLKLVQHLRCPNNEPREHGRNTRQPLPDALFEMEFQYSKLSLESANCSLHFPVRLGAADRRVNRDSIANSSRRYGPPESHNRLLLIRLHSDRLANISRIFESIDTELHPSFCRTFLTCRHGPESFFAVVEQNQNVHLAFLLLLRFVVQCIFFKLSPRKQ